MSVDALRAGFNAVSALMTVLAGDGKRDKGLMTRTTHGSRHVYACNRGLYLAPGQHATGGSPCSERCVAAHEALRLGAVFLQALIDEYGDVSATEQLRLLDVAS